MHASTVSVLLTTFRCQMVKFLTVATSKKSQKNCIIQNGTQKNAFKMNTSLLYTYATEFPKMFFDVAEPNTVKW